MTYSNFPDNHPQILSPKIGVLLINLGTPDATDFWSVRRYLKEFLSDRRVIEVNPIFWQILLNCVILNFRPKVTGRAYEKIWDREQDASPLRIYTSEIAKNVGRLLLEQGFSLCVDWAMRYGSPTISDKLEALRLRGCQKILLFALYPQYSATTTASAYDKAFKALSKMRWQPAIRTVPAYPNEPVYIEALTKSVLSHVSKLDWTPEMVITSFHGLPKRYLLSGDPYYCHCAQTSRLLAKALDWPTDRVQLAFQSRFGREEWLRPYIQDLILELRKKGIKRILVIAPGFVSDCLETLEELAISLNNEFLVAGGEKFSYVPCLNASDEGTDVLTSVVLRELAGWIPKILDKNSSI